MSINKLHFICLYTHITLYVYYRSRYADQVYPLVILAQRSLADRIVSAGEVVPQLHFIRAEEVHGPITADVYSTELQLHIPEEEEDGETRLVVHHLDYKAERDPMATSLVKGLLLDIIT